MEEPRRSRGGATEEPVWKILIGCNCNCYEILDFDWSAVV